MALDLTDCQFHGPALPEPFVKFELGKELSKLKLLPKATGDEDRQLREAWNSYRRNLRALAGGGPLRVRNQVIDPIARLIGYAGTESAPDVQTREDLEAGGAFLVSEDSTKRLRVWTTSFNEDLYAPAKRGRAYRFSHLRIAQRVLLATGERLGLLTNGVQLVILISDPARPDSTVTIPLDGGWKRSRDIPDSFKFLLAIASPRGVEAVPDLVEKARLQQTRVTKELRVQARQAIEHFVQEVMDHPANAEFFASHTDRDALAKALWREGLVLVYRLLFILKLESSNDPARSFTFASTSLWRNTFSPSITLARYARDVLERGTETGRLLEDGLRGLFRMFEDGVECTELVVKPLGGALFGADSSPTLSKLAWGERAVARLFDQLLWTPKRRGSDARERVHYGPLDVEDLGRVYEALLELEPGITSESMCRLRRQKLEVVVPTAQGEKYRATGGTQSDNSDDADGDDAESDEDDAPTTGKKTKVQWIEEIPPNRFYLRVGLGRKASGSYYTPHSFVRFLVQETLGPQVADRSPQEDPKPSEILKLKVLDPAMGSGHFLVEACRFLGDKLYEACRLCDEKASDAERKAEKLKGSAKDEALAHAQEWRQRILDLPDPTAELPKYLPSRSPEREESGYSQKKAEALCRRLVATHCLYGVDKNPLAVELAKLSLWLESHAEGMPLTFLDHRLVVGDSLTGPFWDKLIFYPGKPQEPIENLFQGEPVQQKLFHRNLLTNFTKALGRAIRNVRDLEANVGITLAEIEDKKRLKAEMDRALLPFRVAATAWSGGVMLGPEKCDDESYAEMLQVIAQTGDLPQRIESDRLRDAISKGFGLPEIPTERDVLYKLIGSNGFVSALPYDLTFPEVFYPNGIPHGKRGFDAVLGNPPWDTIRKNEDHFFGMYDFAFLDPPTKREKSAIKQRLVQNPVIFREYTDLVENLLQRDRINDELFTTHKFKVKGQLAGRGTYDDYMLFAERATQVVSNNGLIGYVLPSAFHANEGATGTRHLYLEQLGLHCCYSFENRRKLFEIDSRFKFALVVASYAQAGRPFSGAFYLHDDEWLFRKDKDRQPLLYNLDFVRRTGGDYLSLLELRDERDLQTAETCYANGELFGKLCERLNIRLSQEINMTYDSWRFTPTSQVLPRGEDPRAPDVAARLLEMGYLVLHEGKTFRDYDDHWEDRPRYLIAIGIIQDKPHWVESARHFRLAFRDIAQSTNERTAIFSIIPAGCIAGNKAPIEPEAGQRSNASSLSIIGITNSFPFDWSLRLRVAATVNLFILNSVAVPSIDRESSFLSHSALRLTCNHAGYEPLWHEQVGDTWRESNKEPFTWPVLAGDDERWEVRAAIDAVVADAYGLDRSQYEHILSTFSHRSYPKAPHLCLDKFDELDATGLEAFTRKYDPYWDIPLNENLPQPVIDLPVSEGPVGEDNQNLFGDIGSRGRTRTRRRR
ncbi:MAG: N-6 DNA methylase [Thermodesulfobacteriota bacterium]